MADLEKVIKALECCEEFWNLTAMGTGRYDAPCPCFRCPYKGGGATCSAESNAQMLRDARELLEAQRTRVMTLEEAGKEIEIWYESVNGACGYGDLCYDANADLAIYTTHGIKGVSESAYNKTWRCWTSRPTDEQREAVKWE